MDNILTPSRIFIRMIKALFLLLVILSFVFYKSLGQAVAISGYMNKLDPRDEWTELIVTADDTDMRGFTIRDNSASNNWQNAILFNNIAFWNHMRIGTIIMIWHRQTNPVGLNHPSDVNKTDGYIELYAFNPVYFSGGDITNTLNLAQTKDMIQLRNSSSIHVHALGHGSPELGSFTSLPAPKLNHLNGSVADGDAIYVCPGVSLPDYGTNLPNSGTTYTAKNNSTITFGLANTCAASASANKAYWRTIREPQIAAQVVNPGTIVPGLPGSVSFSWIAAIDPYSIDLTVRYLVLRNTVNAFSSPTDGTTYSLGNSIGAATVVGLINSSATTTFTDNTVMNGNTYYYRVYAYRYDIDDLNGNSYSLERGSAYNTINFVSVLWPGTSPLPVELLGFDARLNENQVDIIWQTATEFDNDFFTIEKTTDGVKFEVVGIQPAAGNNSLESHYSMIDSKPYNGLSYYRLKQTDFNGKFQYSHLVPVNKNLSNSFSFSIYPNPANHVLNLTIGVNEPIELNFLIKDIQGKMLKSAIIFHASGNGLYRFSIDQLVPGMYFLAITGEGISQNLKFIKN